MEAYKETLDRGVGAIQNVLMQIYTTLAIGIHSFLMLFSKPLDMTLSGLAKAEAAEDQSGSSLMDLSPLFKITFAVFGFLFVFGTDATDTVIKQSSPEWFGLHVLLARATIFFSSLIAAFIGMSDILVKLTSKSTGNLLGLPNFGGRFSAYSSAFVHGTTSLTIIAAVFLWQEEVDLPKQWANATTPDPAKKNTTSIAYLVLVIIAAYVLKLWQELRHGAQQEAIQKDSTMIGESRDLKALYKFKHARGPAITISVALLMFMLSNLPDNTYWFDDLWTTPAYLFLAIYILVVAMERASVGAGQEWVFGGSHGIVITGGVCAALLFFTGTLVGEQMTQDSIVFALGVVVLDGMRVGYGQQTAEGVDYSNTSAMGDKTAVMYRFFQGAFGIFAFTLVTVAPGEIVDITNSTTGAVIGTQQTGKVTAPVLYGIGLASALVNVMSMLYLSKKMFKHSTENYYRDIASTGLLIASAYLWEHPLDETMNPGWGYAFFVFAILSRFADSLMEYVVSSGYDFKGWVSWYSAEADQYAFAGSIDSPTSDNPRTWFVLLALITSLAFGSQVFELEKQQIRLDNFTNPQNQTIDGPTNEELSSAMFTAVTFIAVHVVVVFAGLVSEVFTGAQILALSRSKFIRTAVSTVVLSSLAVAGGALTIGDTALLKSDSSEARLVMALVSYVVADTVGRELL
jgi:hypothetical protein